MAAAAKPLSSAVQHPDLCTMPLGEASEACLLAFQAWLLALATTALACVKLASAAYKAVLGVPGVQLIHRLAQVRPGLPKQPLGSRLCGLLARPASGTSDRGPEGREC